MSSYVSNSGHVPTHQAAHDWRDHTYRRLLWLYGAQAAYAKLTARDPATRADLAAWHDLGRKGRAAG